MLIAILKLVRYKNLLIISAVQFWIFYALFPNESVQEFLPLFVATISTAIGGYIINDYFDIEIDKINKEIVVTDSISKKIVLILYVFSLIVSVISSTSLPVQAFYTTLIIICFLFLYSFSFKKSPVLGNLVVSFCTALSIFIFYLTYKNQLNILLLYSVFALDITFIRELIKDIEDIKGDERMGAKTIPILIGVQASKYLLYFIIVVSSFLWLIFSTSFGSLLYYLLVVIIPFMIIIIYLIYRASEKKHYTMLTRLTKLIMILGLFGLGVLIQY